MSTWWRPAAAKFSPAGELHIEHVLAYLMYIVGFLHVEGAWLDVAQHALQRHNSVSCRLLRKMTCIDASNVSQLTSLLLPSSQPQGVPR
jgi:hypothetical protein